MQKCKTCQIVVSAIMIGLAMIIAGGCNTIAGVGEDISAAGQTVADWADNSNPETSKYADAR